MKAVLTLLSLCAFVAAVHADERPAPKNGQAGIDAVRGAESSQDNTDSGLDTTEPDYYYDLGEVQFGERRPDQASTVHTPDSEPCAQ